MKRNNTIWLLKRPKRKERQDLGLGQTRMLTQGSAAQRHQMWLQVSLLTLLLPLPALIFKSCLIQEEEESAAAEVEVVDPPILSLLIPILKNFQNLCCRYLYFARRKSISILFFKNGPNLVSFCLFLFFSHIGRTNEAQFLP